MKIKREETAPSQPPPPPPHFCVPFTFASPPLSESLEQANYGDVDNDADDDEDYSLQRNRTGNLSLLHVPAPRCVLHVTATRPCYMSLCALQESLSLLHVPVTCFCVHCTWLCCCFTSLMHFPVCLLGWFCSCYTSLLVNYAGFCRCYMSMCLKYTRLGRRDTSLRHRPATYTISPSHTRRHTKDPTSFNSAHRQAKQLWVLSSSLAKGLQSNQKQVLLLWISMYNASEKLCLTPRWCTHTKQREYTL